MVAINDVVSKIIWTKRFIENQGFQVETNIEYQDNQITMKIRNTGSGKLEADFTANECPDNQKGISGWQHKVIEPGATITLTFSTGGCNAGFHWWSKNLRLLTPDRPSVPIFGQPGT